MVLRVAGIALLVAGLLPGQKNSQPKDSAQPNPAAAFPAEPLVSCPAGAPLGAVDLRVRSAKNQDALPFRNINRLSEGDSVFYSPILHGSERRPGEVALVLVPAKRTGNGDPLTVTDPKPAAKSQHWAMTETVALAGFVYGPQGLSRKKVRGFLSQDEMLVAQLADYAEKTAQTEALVDALSNSESSSLRMNAALSGFASQYGFAVQLDKNAPTATQAQTLFAAMNPQLASYDPLSSSTAARVGQTASLATAAGTLFLGNPIGLAAGGTAMLLDLRNIAFPDTQFRSSFAEKLSNSSSGVSLCGQRGAAPPHTRVAFIWASRIPNTPAPSLRIGTSAFVPTAEKTPVAVEMPEIDWKYLQRVHDWALIDDKKNRIPVTVSKLQNQKSIELDLTKSNATPGDYRLGGSWDWTSFEAVGNIHVRQLCDFRDARLEPVSQDRLLAKVGKIPVTLAGGDFQFTTGVQLRRIGDEFATAEPVRFILPKGLREGPQDRMDIQVDTTHLDPGQYEFLVSQQATTLAVPFKILPNPPRIDNLPILVNQGVATQHYVLKGERLASLQRLQAADSEFELGTVSEDEKQRSITIRLNKEAPPGTMLALSMFVQDRSEPMALSDAVQVTGPLPVVASSKLSLPATMPITLHPNEFPAGLTLTAMLDVKNLAPNSVLRLACANGMGVPGALLVGTQTPSSSLQQLSQDQLFLSYDTSALPAGCKLQIVLDNGRSAKSEPFDLAEIIRVPQVESFETNPSPTEGSDAGPHVFILTGRNLEMIQKVGWTSESGSDVTELPAPIPGQGQKQSLRVILPDPPFPRATLCLWMRGDAAGRQTTIASPPIPVPVPASSVPTPVAAPVPTPAPEVPSTPPHSASN
jgi:hypothetical protein